jgi:sugar porter (SP) family MFS transporter
MKSMPENSTSNDSLREGINGRVFFWALTAALAGFLFGFDTVVISGAEQKIQALWNLSPGMHGVAIASALYGTVVGALFGGWPTDRFGRRNTLLWLGLLFIASAIGTALAQNVFVFIIARIIGGLGIGISTVVAPLYISEIAPPKHRGILAGMFQFNIVFGIIIAYLSNALLAGTGENAWRWMLGVAAFPSLIYMIFCFGIPESPRWLLVRKGNRKSAIEILHRIQPALSAAEIDSTANGIVACGETRSAGRFWTRQLRIPILLAFLIAFFNQFSGINAILYFAPRIFELAGLGEKTALLQSVGIGITNLVFTFVGLSLIDRLGRRALLFIGSFGYIISLGLVAWGFFSGHYSIVPVCIFAFIAAHAIGQGTVIWVFISEIFPNMQRAEGQTLGCTTHWCCAALLTSLFPKMVSTLPPGFIFLFFCGMMVLQLVWVKTMVIETMGVSLEQVQKRLNTTG